MTSATHVSCTPCLTRVRTASEAVDKTTTDSMLVAEDGFVLPIHWKPQCTNIKWMLVCASPVFNAKFTASKICGKVCSRRFKPNV